MGIEKPEPQINTNEGFCWRVVATSVTGSNHEKKDTKCQDSYYWRTLNEQILIAAVADGAGSAMFGDIGAKVSARTAVKAARLSLLEPIFGQGFCSNFLLDRNTMNYHFMSCSGRKSKKLAKNLNNLSDVFRDAFRAALKKIESEALSRQATPRDLATTLILLIATPDYIAAAQIGDGSVVVSMPERDILAITIPQKGEYVNETKFLISHDALNEMQIQIHHDSVEYIAMFSDGLQSLALEMPENLPYLPFFLPLFRFISSADDKQVAKVHLSEFLRSARVRERTDDDLTLLLAAIKKNCKSIQPME